VTRTTTSTSTLIVSTRTGLRYCILRVDALRRTVLNGYGHGDRPRLLRPPALGGKSTNSPVLHLAQNIELKLIDDDVVYGLIAIVETTS
jgi:hypothetical protein